MRKSKIIMFVAIFLGVLFANLSFAERSSVPDFYLKDLKGKKVHFKDYKNKVMLISFWATWCVPCKRELDDLAKLYKMHHKDGFEVLAIATDGPETFSEIRGVVKRHKWPFRVLVDKEGEVVSILNPRGTVPYSLYIDHTGKIAYDHEGYSQGDAEKMFKRVKELLSVVEVKK